MPVFSFFFSGPDGIEKHIVTKVKLLFIGDISKYFNVVQSDLKKRFVN